MTFSFLVVTQTLIFILSDEVPHAQVVRKQIYEKKGVIIRRAYDRIQRARRGLPERLNIMIRLSFQ